MANAPIASAPTANDPAATAPTAAAESLILFFRDIYLTRARVFRSSRNNIHFALVFQRWPVATPWPASNVVPQSTCEVITGICDPEHIQKYMPGLPWK